MILYLGFMGKGLGVTQKLMGPEALALDFLKALVRVWPWDRPWDRNRVEALGGPSLSGMPESLCCATLLAPHLHDTGSVEGRDDV